VSINACADFGGAIKSRCPVTTSAGRLFDGVAALVGLRQTITFEGQAAMALEYAADPYEQAAYLLPLIGADPIVLDWEPLLAALLADLRDGASTAIMSGRFHNTLVEASVAVAKAIGESQVALSGGCFQNRILLEGALREMGDAGFQPFHHHLVPTNDGGLSLGQAVCAASLMQAGGAARPITPLASPEAEASAPFTEAMNDHEQ